MKPIVSKTYQIIRAALFGAALLFVSCDDSNSTPLGELNRNVADRTIVEAFLVYKDSGRVTMELKSPLIEEFTLIDSPYTIMRKGVNIKFWNSNNPEANFLKADWAKIIDRKKFYEGKGNVEMINNDGDTLRTEHIYWDNLNRRIFTQDTVTIKRIDGTINISNHGLTATEDFKEFTGDNSMKTADVVEVTPCSLLQEKNSSMPILYCGITSKTSEKFAGSIITFLDNGPLETEEE